MSQAHAFFYTPLVNSGVWRTLAWLGVALQAAALVAVVLFERWHGALTIGAFLVLSTSFLLLQGRLPGIFSFLIVIATIGNAFGWTWNLFHQFVWYDEAIHAFTPFALVAAIVYRLWTRDAINSRPGGAAFVLEAALIGLGIGIAWELIEMTFLDLAIVDTVVDLIMDTIGAAAGGWFAGWVIDQQGERRSA